jgi:hypothetical protein
MKSLGFTSLSTKIDELLEIPKAGDYLITD